MLSEPLRLDSIGLLTGTDKSSAHHNYLSFYERFFEPLRNLPIKFLEIGVFEGASLSLWEQYFPKASIIGADINRDVLRFANDRSQIAIVDQSNLQDLVDLGVKHGPFDIIIDDGSHLWEHQLTSLRTLFPFVKKDGFYIIEDLQTNFGRLAERYKGVATDSCVEYLKRIVDFRVGDEAVDIDVEEDAFLRTYGRAVDFVVFSRHVCLIRKSAWASRELMFVATPLVSPRTSNGDGPFTLLAHVGGYGDVQNLAGCFVNIDEASDVFIEGFMLRMTSELAAQVQYRGRLASGVWTDWVFGNEFVGSRGRADNLTGVSVKLSGDLYEAYRVVVTGRFRGESKVMVVEGGQDCISSSSHQPIRGLQVELLPKDECPTGPGASTSDE